MRRALPHLCLSFVPTGRLSLALVLAPLLCVAACSNEGEPGACFRESEGTCIQYGRPQGAAGKRMCSGNKWIAGEKACPTDKRLGLCTRKGGKPPEYVYSGAPNNFTLSSARNSCDFGGGYFEPHPGAK